MNHGLKQYLASVSVFALTWIEAAAQAPTQLATPRAVPPDVQVITDDRWLADKLASGELVSAATAHDPATEDNLVKVLRTTNKAQTNRFVCETLEFRNVNPFNVINFLWAPVSREEGGIYSFVHPTEDRGYVVVICPEYQLPYLRALAAELDRPELNSAPGSKYIYYRMRHRSVADPGFLRVALYYAGSSGILLPDVETNSLVIYDAPDGSDHTEQALVELLDLPLNQVEVQTRIYEVSVSSDGALGLDFEAWKNGPGQLLGAFRATGETFNVVGSGHSDFNQRGSGYYLDYPSAFFDFLVKKGKAQLLTDTKISAVNRVPAVLSTGEQILYYEVRDPQTDREVHGVAQPVQSDGLAFPTNGKVVSGGNIRMPYQPVPLNPPFPLEQFPQENRPISSTIQAVDTGVELVMVPTIGDQSVSLDLNLKVTSVTGYDGQGRPAINSRQMTDSMAISDGTTVVFGGLTRERTVKTTRKVPVLGSLPVLGYLFGGEITSTHRSIVVVSVSPRLVPPSNLTEEDDVLARQASGEEVVVLPRSEFCFEQDTRSIIH